jgi:hypothetical protein
MEFEKQQLLHCTLLAFHDVFIALSPAGILRYKTLCESPRE